MDEVISVSRVKTVGQGAVRVSHLDVNGFSDGVQGGCLRGGNI